MSSDPIRAALARWHGLLETDLLCLDNPAETDWGAVASAAAQTRAALASSPAVDEPAVPHQGGREPAAVVGESIELRVQRLEERLETQRAALLDAFQQIDRLKGRVDFHYLKINRMEEAICEPALPAPAEGEQ